MAKKTTMTKNQIKEAIKDIGIYDSNITTQEITSYSEEIMIRYGINVLLQRMAPNIIDGLLPAKRRALYTLFKDMGSKPDGDFSKVADIAGRTIGKYHPHGLASVETCITNMGQNWSMYPTLIEPQGNYGNIFGASPAAGRYIEGKLSEYAYECFFKEFDESIIDMIPNYTRRDLEPLYLPAKYPNFLVTGNTGIGVGFTSNIPKFNLREAFELTIGLIENPNMTKVHLFPDSPRGYDIIDREDAIETCATGDGTFRMRGRMNLVEEGRKRYISITNVTEQTDLEKINEGIIKLIKAGKLQGISNIKDESKKTFLDYRLILKPEANAHEIMDIIYRSTAMEDSITVKMNFAEKINFVSLGLKDSILEWIMQREDIKQRTYAKQLKNFKEREHTLSIIMRILDSENIGITKDIFLNSNTTADAVEALVDTYGITSMQASAIADMKNSQLTRDNRDRAAREYDKLQNRITDTTSMVRGKDAILNDMVKELEQGIILFGKDRMCRVISEESTKPVITKHTIVVTKKFIKKLSQDIHHPGSISQGDEVVMMLRDVPNDGKVTILDKQGKIYNIPLSKLLSNELTSKGANLKDEFGIGEDIVFVFWTHEDDDNTNKWLLTCTENGIIKKTCLEEYSKLKMFVTQGALVSPDDNICYASIITPQDKKTLIYMNNGYGLILDLDNVTTTGRVTRGSQHVKVEDGVNIQGICNGNADNIVIVTKKGYGKLCRLDDVEQAKKKDALTRLTSLHEDDEVIFIKAVDRGDVVKFTYEEGSLDMNVADIPTETRLSKGKKLVPVKRGTNIVKVSII